MKTDATPNEPNRAPKANPPGPDDPAIRAALSRYWRTNITIMAVLLVIWGIAGLGCGILFAEALNGFKLGGFPLGFWFAQQGSIIVFVFVILTYCILLNRLDKKHLAELKALGYGDDADMGAGR